MENQTLILVDDNDTFLGYEDRTVCHAGKGKKHRAFVTLLIDKDGKVLLQKRKHILFDNLWDFTVISHNLHLSDHDESYQEASDRSLRREMGIPPVTIKNLGGFSYFAPQDDLCENEYCVVLVGHYDSDYVPNLGCVYEAKKMPLGDFIVDVKANPSLYTPWTVLAMPLLEEVHYPVIS